MSEFITTPAKIHVTFRMYHEAMVPYDVSQFLGLEPSFSQNYFEPFQLKGKVQDRYPSIPGWFLSSKEHVSEKRLDNHLRWLFDALTPKAEKLHQLQQKGYRTDIQCYWYAESGNTTPSLSIEHIANLHLLRLPIWFDIYF